MSNVFESAKKALNDFTCPRCKYYSFCHNGTDEEMKSCVYLSLYLAGYSDAVNYFEHSLNQMEGIKNEK